MGRGMERTEPDEPKPGEPKPDAPKPAAMKPAVMKPDRTETDGRAGGPKPSETPDEPRARTFAAFGPGALGVLNPSRLDLSGLGEVLNPVTSRRRPRGWWHRAARLRTLALAAGLAATALFALAPVLAWLGLDGVAALLRAPLYPLALAAILFAFDERLTRLHRRHDLGPD